MLGPTDEALPGVLELSLLFDAGSSWAALASPTTEEGLLPVGLFSRRKRAMHSDRVHSWMGGSADTGLASCLNLYFGCLCDWAAVAVVVDGGEEEGEVPREGGLSSTDYV